MGAKFYRANYHSKKLRKRATQTRTWARTLKWVCCKYITCIFDINEQITHILFWSLVTPSRVVGSLPLVCSLTPKWPGSKSKLPSSSLPPTPWRLPVHLRTNKRLATHLDHSSTRTLVWPNTICLLLKLVSSSKAWRSVTKTTHRTLWMPAPTTSMGSIALPVSKTENAI